MADLPASIWEHGPTIHTWSYESVGMAELTGSGALTDAASTAWPAANRAIFVPFSLTKPILAKLLFLYNGAAISGNVDCGLYDAGGRRLVSSGSTAQSGISVLQLFDIADTQIGPGVFYFAVACDNTTATTLRSSSASIGRRRMSGCFSQNTAFPLPATATFAAEQNGVLPVVGLCTRAVM